MFFHTTKFIVRIHRIEVNGKPLGSDDPEEKVPVQEVKHNIIKLIRQRYHHYLNTQTDIFMKYYTCKNEKFIMLFRVHEIKSSDRGPVYRLPVNQYFDVYET